MNKYLMNLLIVFAIIAVVVTPFFVYITVNRDELIYVYILYDYIQYNGHVYDMISGQNSPYHLGSEKRGPVYLVNKSLKVISKKTYDAYVYTGYEGEEEEIYLFFDSAEYMRIDYMTANNTKTDD